MREHAQGGNRVSGAGTEVNFLSVKAYSGGAPVEVAEISVKKDCGFFTEDCDLKYSSEL